MRIQDQRTVSKAKSGKMALTCNGKVSISLLLCACEHKEDLKESAVLY